MKLTSLLLLLVLCTACPGGMGRPPKGAQETMTEVRHALSLNYR